MKIIELKPSTKVKGRFLVKLDEGTLLRVGEQEILDYALFEGKEISIEEAQQLEQSGNLSTLKNKAYNLLTRKPVSRRDLERKLQDWEATEEETREICERFEELNLINDQEYSKLLARHYHRKGYGEKRIQQEFYKHGISRDFWEDALGELESNEEAMDKFLQQKLKGESPDQKQIKKVSDALARRGFSWSEIKEALLRYDQTLSQEHDLWEDT